MTSVAARYETLGLSIAEGRPATADEVRASGSSWAKRLRAPQSDRDVWRLDLQRRD